MTTPYAEVIGDPISHSKSPTIHRFWLEALGIDADYRAAHVTPDKLAAYIGERRADPAWRGCNVTLPHKEAVIAHVAGPGEVRENIGAMNTVLRAADGTLTGTNTDAAGFFSPLAGVDLAGKPVTVIGAGGAARAVLFALQRCGVGDVTLINRSVLKGAALLAGFGLKGQGKPLDVTPPPSALIVNTSTLGMVGMPAYEPDLGDQPDDCVAYDIVYAPLVTPLLAIAEDRGLETIDGLEMLVGQAAVAFELFFGAAPPRDRDGELREILLA